MAHPSRRAFVQSALGLTALGALPAQAQNWPSGNIRLVVPFPAGGSVDAIARLVQPGLQQRLGVTVIVENRPGSSGSIGAREVAKAAPDGNSWLFVFDTHAVNPALIPNLPFDTVKDLAPVMLIGTAPMVLACHPSRPYKTLADVVAAAKANPDKVTYGTIGNGSLGHLAMTLLGKQAGIKLVHVPYRGGGPLTNDVLANSIDLAIASSAVFAPQINAGALRPLVQTAGERIAVLPNVPTLAESGFPGLEAKAWWGVFAPGETPAAITERFRSALETTFREERISKQLREAQQVHLVLGGPDTLRSFFGEQMQIWGAVVRENGIRPD